MPQLNQVKVPELGESITEAIIATWLRGVGEYVQADDPIVELETDKITVEVPAPSAGVLVERVGDEGATVNVGALIATIDAEGVAPATSAAETSADPAPAPAAAPTPTTDAAVMPAARAEGQRRGIDPSTVQGSGRGGRVLKEDVMRAPTAPAATPRTTPARAPETREERVRMTPLRKRIAERLVGAQQEAAILTTFNECDMSAVMNLRKAYKDQFLDKHGVKLGFMSFFVKAVVKALQACPAVNAEIDGDDIIYKNHYDIGVAVGGGKGLVVPVVRDADTRSFADIEREIGRLAGLAKNNKLTIADLTGGTFTISNGGIYGSMLSTPILNPPQTGILGLHNIVERPVAVNGNVEIRPVMYLALSYDHRLVDGREAVQFLVDIKSSIEDPRRLMLEV
ncbi:MAG: 2-oxoglutarate dehydrogenase complex dihydrolipoyllysine-residue succinyltransferase [Nannocystaceae bacterium]